MESSSIISDIPSTELVYCPPVLAWLVPRIANYIETRWSELHVGTANNFVVERSWYARRRLNVFWWLDVALITSWPAGQSHFDEINRSGSENRVTYVALNWR